MNIHFSHVPVMFLLFFLIGSLFAAPAYSKTVTAVAPPPDDIEKQCDALAGDPADPEVSSIGVKMEDMDGPAAMKACKKAWEEDPITPRISYQYGRALLKEQSYEEAGNLFRYAAAEGHILAQYELGLILSSGRIQRVRPAVYWFRLAAEQGHIDAQYELGLGIATGQDRVCEGRFKCRTRGGDEALKWFRLAAEQGHIRAQFQLGLRLATGLGGGKKDRAEAAEWYRKAAEQGHVRAQYELGMMYAISKGGVRRDLDQAVKWWRKAATQGNSSASYYLARHYYRNKEYVEAGEWYRKAAAQGDVNSQEALTKMYADGLIIKNEQFRQQTTEAIAECDRLAAYPGSPVIPGKGVTFEQLNAETAIQACARAVAERPDSARLQFQYGRALAKGGVYYGRAYTAYHKAAIQGYAPAQYNLAGMYWNGKGIGKKPDPYVALKWFRQAAEQGHAHAQNQMGFMYEKYWMDAKVVGAEPGAKARGFYTRAEGWAKAMEWYQKAAAQRLQLAEDSIAALQFRIEVETHIANNPPPAPGPFDCHLGAMWNC